MIVEELIKELLKQDPKAIVVMSRDSEGNSFSPLSDLSQCRYEAYSTWSGEVRPFKLSEEDIENGYTEKDLDNSVPAICFWPTN